MDTYLYQNQNTTTRTIGDAAIQRCHPESAIRFVDNRRKAASFTDLRNTGNVKQFLYAQVNQHSILGGVYDSSGVVQRTNFGLNKDKVAGKFAKRINKRFGIATTAKDKESVVLIAANKALDSARVPHLKGIGWAGDQKFSYFDIVSWQIILSGNGFSASYYDTNYISWLVGTAYHEARHCEQYFLIARRFAGEGKNQTELIAKMGMPQDIANEAVKRKIKSPSHTEKDGYDQRLEKFQSAGLWEDCIYGTGSEARTDILRDLSKSDNHAAYLNFPEERDARDAESKAIAEYGKIITLPTGNP